MSLPMAQKLPGYTRNDAVAERYCQWNRQDSRKPAVESDSWQILSSKTLFGPCHVTRRPVTRVPRRVPMPRSLDLSITMARPFAPSLPFPLVLGTDSLHSGSLTTHASTRSFNQPLDLDGSTPGHARTVGIPISETSYNHNDASLFINIPFLCWPVSLVTGLCIFSTAISHLQGESSVRHGGE